METMGKVSSQVECEQPDDNEGGIRRRLRDRDLLMKRRAEAEEKEIHQWVYGAQRKRQRGRSVGRTGPSRKGWPKKNKAAIVPQPAQEGEPLDGRAEAGPQGPVSSQTEDQLPGDPAQEAQLVISHLDPAEQPLTANVADIAEELLSDTVGGVGESLPPPSLPPPPQPLSLGLLLAHPTPPPPKPRPEDILTPPPQELAPPTETASFPPKEVTIEDLGPDNQAVEPRPTGELLLD